MAKQLTDIQRVVLAAAAERDNGNALPIPDSLGFSAGTRAIVLMGLLARRLLAERSPTGDEPVWREDEQTGKVALIITPVGLEAIGVEPDAGAVQGRPAIKATKPRRAVPDSCTAASAAELPRQSKRAAVMGLLRRPEGASIADIMAATDWQAHSCRGFLTATIKGRMGLSLTSEKGDDAQRRYRIEVPAPGGD